MNVFIAADSEALRKYPRSMLSEFHDVKIVAYADACKYADAEYSFEQFFDQHFDKSFQFMRFREIFICRNRTSRLNKQYLVTPTGSHGKIWIN
jgi:hypothetical protein